MGEIDKLPPACRIPPTRPAVSDGDGKQAPRRKPATRDRQQERQRRHTPDQDDTAHVDEYA